MSRQLNGKSFFWGAVLGGIVGGMTALLLAPKSGEKLRKDLSKKCRETSDKAQEVMEDVCDQAQDLVVKAKEIAQDAKKAASHFIKEWKDD